MRIETEVGGSVPSEYRRLTGALSTYSYESRHAMNFSLSRAARVAVPFIRAQVPVRTGKLKRSIGVGVLRRRGRIVATYLRANSARTGAFHAHLIEHGTAHRYHRNGKFVGRVRATNFFRTAITRAAPQIWNRYVEVLNTEFPKLVADIKRRFNI